MYIIQILTYILPDHNVKRYVYLPPFLSDGDTMSDVTALSAAPDPNTVVWEGRVSAATLDAWLADPDIFILWYEAVAE